MKMVAWDYEKLGSIQWKWDENDVQISPRPINDCLSAFTVH